MKTRLLLTLSVAIMITMFFSSNAVADQLDQPITMTKNSEARFDPKFLLNDFYGNQKEDTQLRLQQHLDKVLSLLSEDLPHARELGFGTDPKDAKIPRNVLPFLVFHVGLRDIRDFVFDKEASDLLVFTNQLLFPVAISKQEVSSSVTVRLLEAHEKLEHKNQQLDWRITRWGLPKLIHQLDKLKRKFAPDTLGFLVSIPSLNRNFLGYEDGADIKLVPLAPDGLFKKETSLSAKKVFLDLVEEAKSVDDSPR